MKLATSTDLLNWTFRTNLANHASQPTLAKLSDGGYLLVYEQDLGCTGTGAGRAGGQLPALPPLPSWPRC